MVRMMIRSLNRIRNSVNAGRSIMRALRPSSSSDFSVNRSSGGSFSASGLTPAKFLSKARYTDEEVERNYEAFYEDVHTEFFKYGEIVNFKVCRNGAFHLRGNLYVHYHSLDSVVMAYRSMNGRYFAGKQVNCEFVGVTRWKISICEEYMKSRLKTCSRSSTFNFIHCFRNPGGDYEWSI